MDTEEIQAMSSKERYSISIYWTVTTLSTVGYGDISATNKNE